MPDLLRAITALQGRFSERVAQLVATLDTQGGNLVRSKKNLAKVATIIGELKRGMVDDEFAGAVAEYVGGFDTSAAVAIDRLKSFGPIEEGILEAITAQFQTITEAELLSADAFGASVFNPIANDLIVAISSKAPLSSTIEAVTATSKRLTDTATGISQGAPITLERTVTSVIADQVGAEFFLFQGRPIATTRPWCREREGKVWHRKEIEEWGRDAAAGDGWQGMTEGTNEKTIFIYVGGYFGERQTCRHVLVPVHRTDVPASDLARMREKGLLS